MSKECPNKINSFSLLTTLLCSCISLFLDFWTLEREVLHARGEKTGEDKRVYMNRKTDTRIFTSRSGNSAGPTKSKMLTGR